MKGTVKWFNTQKGYGFIVGDDGTDYFVHYSNIKVSEFRHLDAGDGTLVITGSANILISMIPSSFMKQLKSSVFDRKES